LAVKIVRQPKKIALIGAPSSAAAFAPGIEKAPAALRAAGLVGRLQSIGYEVTDLGDCAPRLFAQDDEHPRARNAAEVVAGLNDLRPRVEQAVKTGALVLVLGGECVQSMAVVAGLRRYYKRVNLIWLDRDAHFTGRGAPELVRFWGEPPLVREPDVTLFGLERIDPPEQEFLSRSPMRRVLAVDAQRTGVAAAAHQALEQMHAEGREYVLHFDTDVIAQEDFGAVPVPGPGGLRADEVREALRVFASHKNLLAMDVAEYNPDQDASGNAGKLLVDLLADALAARLETLTAPVPQPAEASVSSDSGESA